MLPEKIDEDDLNNDHTPGDLSFDEENRSFEFDVDDDDPDYEHPADYPTVSEGATDDDSTYDEANPFVGDEYAEQDELKAEDLENAHMHITDEKNLKVSGYDERLSESMEDYRDDLDAEGYPKKK
ncbi:hypothetical protein [Sphingobacterium suaedae]|uniref:Uncharacterized protein n=1 Tax=Sphingobacterium suaedae TaxID=1686402 RepID=A0ABW5KIZ5_9SPHI